MHKIVLLVILIHAAIEAQDPKATNEEMMKKSNDPWLIFFLARLAEIESKINLKIIPTPDPSKSPSVTDDTTIKSGSDDEFTSSYIATTDEGKIATKKEPAENNSDRWFKYFLTSLADMSEKINSKNILTPGPSDPTSTPEDVTLKLEPATKTKDTAIKKGKDQQWLKESLPSIAQIEVKINIHNLPTPDPPEPILPLEDVLSKSDPYDLVSRSQFAPKYLMDPAEMQKAAAAWGTILKKYSTTTPAPDQPMMDSSSVSPEGAEDATTSSPPDDDETLASESPEDATTTPPDDKPKSSGTPCMYRPWYPYYYPYYYSYPYYSYSFG